MLRVSVQITLIVGQSRLLRPSGSEQRLFTRCEGGRDLEWKSASAPDFVGGFIDNRGHGPTSE